MTSKALLRIEPPAGALGVQPPASSVCVARTHQKRQALTFGQFVMTVYDIWDKRRASGIVWLAVNARLVEFRRQPVLISERSPQINSRAYEHSP